MQSEDYDNPKAEARWLKEQRQVAQAYLDKQEIQLAKVEEKPAWFVAPYVAIWKTQNFKKIIWIVSGDLPTDYFETSDSQPPRKILEAFGKRWKTMSAEMIKGNLPKDFHVGRIEDQKELGALLKTRAKMFLDWAKDEEIWQ